MAAAAKPRKSFAVEMLLPYGSITVYKSTNAPSAEGTSGGEEWIVPVAKVKVEDNVLTIEEQYLTHNPTQQLGYFTLQVTPPP